MDGTVESKPAPAGDLRELDEKHDILFAAPTSSTDGIDTKTAAIAKDGSIDVESAEITADTTLDTPLQLVTKTLDTSDDPTQRIYTFRAFFLGIGLSAFGAVLAEIFYFKPQTVNVSIVFLIMIAYCLGEATVLIPRWGPVGRFLNPGPFTQKEHVFIVIMASSAATCALGTEQLAAQSLYYGHQPNAASAIFMLFSSQCIGYGLLGGIRKAFIYPTKFVWPSQLPNAALFQSMHLNKDLAKKRLKIFWCICLAVMVWEIVPQWMFPLTTGISIFCLANQNSAFFTRLFGGSNGNEGMGFLSWCMDWQYIGEKEFTLPMNTLVNELIGYVVGIALTVGAYYYNLWDAKKFPFMAQDLFTSNGTLYDQTQILGPDNEVDPAALQAYGLPRFATSQALSLLVMNMGVTAAVVHVLLWNWHDVKFIFAPFRPSALKQNIKKVGTWHHRFNSSFWKSFTSDADTPRKEYPGTEGDPHYAAMRAYKEVPSFWYFSILAISILIGLICCYQQKTGLPWWAFLLAVLLAWILTVMFACMYGIVGFYYQPTSAVQMIGAYMVPRRPVANMMFTLYGSNALVQAIQMLGDLKLAQYAKLPPRATFLAQILGTCAGSVFNWVMMNSIVDNRREILLSVQGTNIWSGQNVQTFNAQAVAWGGAANEIFGRHGTYWMVPMGLFFGIFAPMPFWIGHKYFPQLKLNYFNTFIICTWLGWLSVGINSSLLAYFVFGFFAQGYLRRYKPVLFAKWNNIFAAAIAGGCSLIIFILTFAVAGGSGKARDFPTWWGNNMDGNMDRCKYLNGT
ncbi:OPT superfamily oligopeptide transporter [Neurospora tetraspora]|uniref:OPT superfamily oligopeptide transporter n=1 Tax=Neurospora tetraspora TaxID=94610 RepID=A0AAE0MSF1_9PEZI|nr:OPT superfamily oligopeptide transporter [Neurospora tetraspora]